MMVNVARDLSPSYIPKMKYPIDGVQFISDYDTLNKIPSLVYYTVTNSKLNGYGRYAFHVELLKNTATLNDYLYSGYDKGHLFPSGSSDSYTSNYHSFDMVNIAPQLSSFNRGIWKSTEDFERKNCDPYCYVITGTIISNNYINNRVNIPKQFYKIIYNPFRNQMIGFILNQTDYGDLRSYAKTVDEIEKLVNIDFFCQLNIQIQLNLESKIDLTKWNW